MTRSLIAVIALPLAVLAVVLLIRISLLWKEARWVGRQRYDDDPGEEGDPPEP